VPKLSIITINYNNANGLHQTIQSVITQKFNDFEYIIIDGGSSDGSVDVIKQFSQKITYWLSEADKGIYNAMNKGIVESSGDYLLFINSGDWLCNPDVLKNVFDTNPTSDLIFGNMIKLYKNGDSIRITGTLESQITILSFFHETICHPSSFFKRNLFSKFGFYDENLKIVSDWKFYLIAFGLNDSTIKYENIDISFYNTEGLSSIQVELAQNERKEVLRELLPFRVNLFFENNIQYLVKLETIKNKNISLAIYTFSQFLLVNLTKIILRFQNKVKNIRI
jgi:glycosyltransferase involved in cell wall biosynthesis